MRYFMRFIAFLSTLGIIVAISAPGANAQRDMANDTHHCPSGQTVVLVVDYNFQSSGTLVYNISRELEERMNLPSSDGLGDDQRVVSTGMRASAYYVLVDADDTGALPSVTPHCE